MAMPLTEMLMLAAREWSSKEFLWLSAKCRYKEGKILPLISMELTMQTSRLGKVFLRTDSKPLGGVLVSS